MNDLANHLFAMIEDIRNPEMDENGNPIKVDLEEAKIVNQAAKNIIEIEKNNVQKANILVKAGVRADHIDTLASVMGKGQHMTLNDGEGKVKHLGTGTDG
jgi:hypothetical protein